jgi:hypothetical protein
MCQVAARTKLRADPLKWNAVTEVSVTSRISLASFRRNLTIQSSRIVKTNADRRPARYLICCARPQDDVVIEIRVAARRSTCETDGARS